MSAVHVQEALRTQRVELHVAVSDHVGALSSLAGAFAAARDSREELARTNDAGGPLLAVVITCAPIDRGDGPAPVCIFIGLLGEGADPDGHPCALSRLSALLRQRHVRARLAEATAPEHVIAALGWSEIAHEDPSTGRARRRRPTLAA